MNEIREKYEGQAKEWMNYSNCEIGKGREKGKLKWGIMKRTVITEIKEIRKGRREEYDRGKVTDTHVNRWKNYKREIKEMGEMDRDGS